MKGVRLALCSPQLQRRLFRLLPLNKTYYCTAVRREIGKEQRVKVSDRKGIANQTGPESCVAHREVRDEALTGEPAGQP